MTNSPSDTRIVRPFGLTGGRYEVGPAGMLHYRLAWAIALIAVAAIMAGIVLKWPTSTVVAVGAIGFVAAVLLSILTVRNGKKL